MNANRVKRHLNKDKQTRCKDPDHEGSVSSDEEEDVVPDHIAFDLMAETLCSDSTRTHEDPSQPMDVPLLQTMHNFFCHFIVLEGEPHDGLYSMYVCIYRQGQERAKERDLQDPVLPTPPLGHSMHH